MSSMRLAGDRVAYFLECERQHCASVCAGYHDDSSLLCDLSLHADLDVGVHSGIAVRFAGVGFELGLESPRVFQ